MVRALCMTILSVGLLILPGCAGSDSPAAGPASAVDTVTVVARDVSFPTHHYETIAGKVELDYRNDGAIAHNLQIEGVDGFELTVAAHGDTDAGTVTLQPGSYTIFCGVPGHRAAGMEATLQVN
jgi:uncharacterized cupredoxin-like copper-binding protein